MGSRRRSAPACIWQDKAKYKLKGGGMEIIMKKCRGLGEVNQFFRNKSYGLLQVPGLKRKGRVGIHLHKGFQQCQRMHSHHGSFA